MALKIVNEACVLGTVSDRCVGRNSLQIVLLAETVFFRQFDNRRELVVFLLLFVFSMYKLGKAGVNSYNLNTIDHYLRNRKFTSK